MILQFPAARPCMLANEHLWKANRSLMSAEGELFSLLHACPMSASSGTKHFAAAGSARNALRKVAAAPSVQQDASAPVQVAALQAIVQLIDDVIFARAMQFQQQCIIHVRQQHFIMSSSIYSE